MGPLDGLPPGVVGTHLDGVAATPVEELVLVHAVDHAVVRPVQAPGLLDFDADQLQVNLNCFRS